MENLVFNESNIRLLFGHEAAEDEPIEKLKKYYLKTDVYNQLSSDLSLYILVGHKGIGKSALLKVLNEENENDGGISITIQPDDMVEVNLRDEDFLLKIRSWKNGLAGKILEHLISKTSDYMQIKDDGSKIKMFANQFSEVIAKILGKKSPELQEKYIGVDAVQFAKIFKSKLFHEQSITVYLDDLDRGWKNSKSDVQNMSAMLNAVRDLSRDIPNLKFRLALRSDVYYAVRTSDETTDKIDGSVVWQSWSNHEILVMLIKRIENFFGREINETEMLKLDQKEISTYLDSVFEPRFRGSGKWENAPMYRVIMSLIRRRPRDLVKLCTLSARQAFNHRHCRITTQDMEAVFNNYSHDRMTDTANEYKSELPNISDLLLKMKPTQKELRKNHPSIFTRAELLEKIKNIIRMGNFTFCDGRMVTANEIAAFMYKINFLTARKNVDGIIQRLYYDENRYIYNEFTDFGYDYEIHPAYRWALQPDRIDHIFKDIELSMDD